MFHRRVRSKPDTSDDPRAWADAVHYTTYLQTFRDGISVASPHHPEFTEDTMREFADDGRGDLLGLLQTRAYLSYLGVGGVGTGPVAQYGEDDQDSVYSITDHRKIARRTGNEAVLRAITSEFPQDGIRVWGDLVAGHVSQHSSLFQAALRNPTGPEGRMFHFLREEDLPQYGNLTSVFVDNYPDPWSYNDLAKLFYLHRFYGDQPALDVRNPAVRRMIWEAHRKMLGDWGYRGVRWDACMYWDSPPGSTGEHTREALDAGAEYRRLIDAEFPGTVIAAEAAGPRSMVAPWVRGKRAHMVWDFELAPLAFYALVTRDWGPLEELFRTTPAIDADAAWGIFLRNWDELQLAYVDDEVREVLFATLGVNGRFRTHRGLKQRLADLTPGSDAHVMLTTLTMCVDGVPWIYAGDEVAAIGDRNLDERWSSRNAFAWDGQHRNAAFSRSSDPLPFPLSPDWETRNVAAQTGRPLSVLERVRRAIMLRNELVALQRGYQVPLKADRSEVLAFARVHDGSRSSAPPEDAICVFNNAPYPVRTELWLDRWRGSRLVELILDHRRYSSTSLRLLREEQPFISWARYTLELPPYGVRVFQPLIPLGSR